MVEEMTGMKLPEALGTINQKFYYSEGKRQMYPCNAM